MNAPEPFDPYATRVGPPPGPAEEPTPVVPEPDARQSSTFASSLDSVRTAPGPGALSPADGRTDTPPSTEQSADATPGHVGRYRIDAILGRGSYGRVYKGWDADLERTVAIKVPRRELVSHPEELAAYLAEARTLAQLDHPRIVPVHDVGRTDDGLCYVVSKFVEGSDLAKLAKSRRLSLAEALTLVAHVADALGHAHARGLVHRDVKPANILIDASGLPVLADFGLALRERDFGSGAQLAGTPAYMSPEQARGEGHRVDARSDLFSLGVVLFELLAGRRPFEETTVLVLLDRIATADAPSPRQFQPGLPAEAERICRKALSRRASDRYATAAEFADDLRHFLAVADAASVGAARPAARIGASGQSRSDAGGVGPDNVVHHSDSRPLRIVPKGLRSFDAGDADFFLDLLPGPRDRNGLPESLRFWKTRIEAADPEQTFSVGLIYGPSGCGKSSLMKAGLLPRLADHVVPIYVEATADDTETRLLNGLRKRCAGLPQNLDLTASLAALRLGRGVPSGTKVVLVLDQFEQWLHAKKDEENTELVQALRQCDGDRVQTVVMVRDDFWMAVTRLLVALEVDLVQGRNTAAFDLFDARHAEKVLAAFGRAYGALPAEGALGADQQAFLSQAVASLAESGKVVCVRLALFADMMKGRPWTPAALRDVGGAEGVGVAFLEETFSSPAANPKHRLHQKAARAALKSLLPEPGADIKGHMRSRDELLAASGYAQRPRDFNDLLHLLDAELRLITPTDPEGQERDEDDASPVGRVFDPSATTNPAPISRPAPVGRVSAPSAPMSSNPDAHHAASGASLSSPDGSKTRPTTTRHYQLTHDYLVPSLRDWLTRKQRETRRGRAELLLAERAAAWNAKPLNRHLPAWHEDLRIRLLTNRAARTEPQRRMIRASALYHATRWGMALVMLCVLGFVAQRYESNRRAEIAQQTRENNQKRAESLADAVFTAHPQVVPITIENLKPLRELALPVLQERYADESKPQDQRLHAALALAAFGQVETAFLVDSIATASDGECRNLVTALFGSRDGALSLLHERYTAADVTKDATTRARLAIVALHLGDAKVAIDLCRIAEEPTPRRIFEETLVTWNAGLKEHVEQVEKADDGPLRAAVCLGLGRMKPDSVADAERKAATQFLSASYQHAPDTGTHGAADWALRQWNVELPKLADATQPSDKRNWHINSVGMTMVKLPKDRIGWKQNGTIKYVAGPFYLANREVTVGQFQQFIDDPVTPESEKPDVPSQHEHVSPTDSHPIQDISWYDAVKYCNWLSRREGKALCYVRTGEKELDEDGAYDVWARIPNADGYHLPAYIVWRYAWAGQGKAFEIRPDVSVLSQYEVAGNRFEPHSKAGRCGSKLPNSWGMFDLGGNVSEWSEDFDSIGVPSQFAKESLSGKGNLRSAGNIGRVVLGGSWQDYYETATYAFVQTEFASEQYGHIGFRVASGASPK